MKFLICFFVIFNFLYAYGGDSKEALEKTAEALSKTTTVKKFSENIKNVIEHNLPIQKEIIVAIGSIAVTSSQGKLNTKEIKNMDIDFRSVLIRPDLEYDFKQKNSSFLLNLKFKY